MPYILVDKSENWKLSEWGGLERIWFDPANPKAPEFTVQWDKDKDTQKWVQYKYNVRARLSGNKLHIEYHKKDNPHLAKYEVYYGVHTLTIENGATHGPSDWHADGEPKSCDGPGWRLEAISGGGEEPSQKHNMGDTERTARGIQTTTACNGQVLRCDA